jgi:hypothetical protein
MNMIHVHSSGTEYQIVRVTTNDAPQLDYCFSQEDLVGVLRRLGVERDEVARVFDRLQDGGDAVVEM